MPGRGVAAGPTAAARLAREVPGRAAALATVAALLAALAPPAAAGDLSLFQHGGGRAVAQAGALVARADDPSAIGSNPAGLAILDEGFSIAVGAVAVDEEDEYAERFRFESSFGPPQPDFVGRSGTSPSTAVLPAFHLAWRDSERLGRWAFGLGLDTPYRRSIDWGGRIESAFFFDRRREIELTQLHAVAAYRLSPSWSLGAGLRYLDGDFDTGLTESFGAIASTGTVLRVPVSIDADAEVDGLGFDLGLRYARDRWGAGAVYRSEVTVEGEVRPRFDVPPVPDPVAAEQVAERIAVSSQPWERRVDLPAEAAVGAWFQPFRAVRAELDVVHTAWSDYDETADPRSSTARRPLSLFFGWDDTTSVRLGIEAELSPSFTLGLGAAHEPSPLPADRADPAAFRGDALVLAAGGTIARGRLKIDFGLSRHDFDTLNDRQAHPRFGLRESRFESEAWVAGLTVRYGWWW